MMVRSSNRRTDTSITSGSLYHGRGKDVPILSILSWDITGCSNLSATCRRPSTKHGTMSGLQRPDSHNSLSDNPGTVHEADETYIGGKARFMHADKWRRLNVKRGRSVAGKVAVMGLLARHGKDGHSVVRLAVARNVRKDTLQANIRANVRRGSKVYTDFLLSYDGLDSDYTHRVIDHAEAYVDGEVHTNSCENSGAS
ncbi:MAG: hypothetical protein DMG02_01415 [Acidobacteria bacterium]|nr:MAG: hypothetical protein DMG02_01415 [Acidobacteriota bacterium]